MHADFRTIELLNDWAHIARKSRSGHFVKHMKDAKKNEDAIKMCIAEPTRAILETISRRFQTPLCERTWTQSRCALQSPQGRFSRRFRDDFKRPCVTQVHQRLTGCADGGGLRRPPQGCPRTLEEYRRAPVCRLFREDLLPVSLRKVVPRRLACGCRLGVPANDRGPAWRRQKVDRQLGTAARPPHLL